MAGRIKERILKTCFECDGMDTWCQIYKEGKDRCQYKDDADHDISMLESGQPERIMNKQMLIEYLVRNERRFK